MDRRTFVFAAAAGLAGLTRPSRPRAETVVPVGVVVPLTGGHAARGIKVRDALMLALDQVNCRPNGSRIAAQVLDCGLRPRAFAAAVRRLVADDGALAVFGLCPPGERAGLADFLAAQSALFWDPAPAEECECSPHVIHGGPTPRQSLGTLLPFMVSEAGPRFVLVGDATGGRGRLLSVAAAMLGEAGGIALGEPVLVASDAGEVWRRVRRDRADVVLSLLEGERQVALLRAFRQERLDPRKVTIASPTLTEADMVAAGPGVAAGHVAAQPYFTTWRTPENALFLNQLRLRHGDAVLPDAEAEAAWWQMHLFAAAVDALGPAELQPAMVREATRDLSVAAPQGLVRLERATLHAALWPKLAVAEPSGRAKVLARTARPQAPEPAWGQSGLRCEGAALDLAAE